MARVILQTDGRIKKITSNPGLGIEVGDLPKGVGLERLRWDGEKIVDLNDLDEMWVNPTTKICYPSEKPGLRKVIMKWKEREHLKVEGDIVRLKTKEEIDEPKKNEYMNRRRKEYPPIGDQLDMIWKFLDTQPNKSPEIESMLNYIKSVKDKWKKPE
jgi:hypothetical protein